MHVITHKRLLEFAEKHPESLSGLEHWYRTMKRAHIDSFATLRSMFPSADQAGKLTVFNISGNKFRLTAAIHYNRRRVYIRNVLAHLDELIDEVGEDENHSLASLMETLGTLIETYEAKNFPEPLGDPINSLAVLMEQHGLTESDLPKVGDHDEVAELLSGKREFSLKQIRALSKRFNIPPEVFIKD